MTLENRFSTNGRGGSWESEGPRRGRPRVRVALYSHDTQGLGHIRRNLLIARALSEDGEMPAILLLSGLREAAAFAMPSGVDCVTLPSLAKGVDGVYSPRSLGVTMDELIGVRSDAISAVLKSFRPDVLIVDKVPLGAFDELQPSLDWLVNEQKTRLVLGLREILDDPRTVHREWTARGYEDAIRRYFSRIWIYGDRRVYDSVRAYGFPAWMDAMARFTGYLNPRDGTPGELAAAAGTGNQSNGAHPRSAPYVLCVVGGGRDGLPLAESFLRAEVPAGHRGMLVTGPLMPEGARATLSTLAQQHGRIDLVEFTTNPCPLIEGAARVIAMGGYNTMCEILAYGKPALIVPRVRPRTEQLIRATRFARLGAVQMLHPDELSAAAVSAWLGGRLPTATPAPPPFDFGGVKRLPVLLQEALSPAQPDKEHLHAAG